MKSIADLLFEAYMLKKVPRSGFQFLGAGNETVAEHSFCTAFIAFVMARMSPSVDESRLVSMCLLHDLPEARTGDFNYVHKQYVKADEDRAVADMVSGIPFGDDIAGLIAEFNAKQTLEAKLAHDADQIAFMLDLKQVKDIGSPGPDRWIPHVKARLLTGLGKKLAEAILKRPWDAWWEKTYTE